jgi:serine/threonine protein kinase/WD40 repeat protein
MSESLTETSSRDGHDDSVSGEVDEVTIQFLKELEGSSDPREVLGRYCKAHPSMAGQFRTLAAARQVLVMSEPVAEDGAKLIGRLGDFRIIRQIAQGGMGAIYEAVQEPFQRRVAVKTIRGDRRHIASGARERFIREQKVLARLHHTHIVPIHAAGQDGDLEYFAMPYIEGAALHHVVRSARNHGTCKPSEDTPSLAELAQVASAGSSKTGDTSDETIPFDAIAAGARALDRAKLILSAKYLRSVANVMADAGDALEHAHQAGIIHRDVKPSNIMVDKYEHCWVVDFGLAAYHAARNGHERPPCSGGSIEGAASGIMGTPRYMAPEQFHERADARTDIWGLGVTLYELLTLRPAFETIVEIESKDTRSPELFVGNLPYDLQAVCQKALCKDPEQRYATARDFADDLRRWLHGMPATASKPGVFRHVALWSRRNPGWSAAGALAVALLLAASGGGIALEAERVTVAEAKSKATSADAEAARQQTRERDRDLVMLQIQQTRLTAKRINWFRDLWTKVVKASEMRIDAALQEQAAASLSGLDAHTAKSFKFGATQLLYNPTGERLLIGGVVEPDGRARLPARIWNTSNQQLEVLPVTSRGPIAFRDGVPVEINADEKGVLIMRSLLSGDVIRSFEVPTHYKLNGSTAATITSDGALVGFGLVGPDDRSALAIWDARTGVLRHILSGQFDSMSISPDKTFAAAGSQAGHVTVWSLIDGREVAHFEDGWNPVRCLSWGRNPMQSIDEKSDAPSAGWLLAAGDAGGYVRAWDVRRKLLRATCPGSPWDVYAVAFSPDGASLASCGRDEIRLWDLWSSRLVLEIPFGSMQKSLTFSPDGRSLAAAGNPLYTKGEVAIFDLEDGHGARTLRGLTGKVIKTVYSPDKTLVAALSVDWRVGIWDRRTGRLLRLLDVPQGIFADNAGLAISPDNRRFAFSAGTETRLWNFTAGRQDRSWKLNPGLGDCLTFLGPDQVLLARFETRKGAEVPGGGDATKHPLVARCYRLSDRGPITPVAEIADFGLDVRQTALSADGRVLVLSGLGCRLDEKTARPLVDENNLPQGVYRSVRAYDPASGARLWAYTFPGDAKGNFKVRPDPTVSWLYVSHELTEDIWIGELCNAMTGARISEPNSMGNLGPDARLWTSDRLTVRERGRATPMVTLDPDELQSCITNGFSDDGRLFAIGTREGAVLVFDLDQVQRQLATVGLGW